MQGQLAELVAWRVNPKDGAGKREIFPSPVLSWKRFIDTAMSGIGEGAVYGQASIQGWPGMVGLAQFPPTANVWAALDVQAIILALQQGLDLFRLDPNTLEAQSRSGTADTFQTRGPWSRRAGLVLGKKWRWGEIPIVNPHKRRLKTWVNKHTWVLMEKHPVRTGLDPITIKVFYFLEFWHQRGDFQDK